MTKDEAIKMGLELCKVRLGIDGSAVIPELVSSIYDEKTTEQIPQQSYTYHFCATCNLDSKIGKYDGMIVTNFKIKDSSNYQLLKKIVCEKIAYVGIGAEQLSIDHLSLIDVAGV